MNVLWQDVRFAVRTWRRQPVIAAVALGSLVLGLGLCLAVFRLYDAAALRPLAVDRPDELVVLLEKRGPEINRGFSYLDVTELGSATRALTGLVASGPRRVPLARPSGSEIIGGELVSGNYFEGLGVRLRYGRGLSDDDLRSHVPVAVVSEMLWRSLFPEATSLGGQTITLNRHTLTIVGVAARPFLGIDPSRDSQFWVPLTEQRALDGTTEDMLAPQAGNWLRVIGRLRGEVTMEAATREINDIEARLTRTPNRPRVRDLTFVPGRRGDASLASTLTSPLQFLVWMGGLLLVVACANLGGLLAARATERTHEIAIRLALGAGRGRIVRMLLVEACVIGCAGIVTSIWLAGVLIEFTRPFLWSAGQPLPLDVSLNWRTVAFAWVAGMVATAGSLLPIGVRLLRRDETVQVGPARTVAGGRRATRWRHALVVAQFALSFGLLVVAALLGRTLVNLRAIPTGFDIDRVALLSVDLTQASYDASRARTYFDAVLERLRALPGVSAAGLGRIIPLAGGGSRAGLAVPGYTPSPGETLETNYNVVSGSYFEAMGITLVAGRSFGGSDGPDGPRVAIVNEAMAARFWGGHPAVGRTFHLGDRTEVTVVGVAADVKYRGLREELRASFYLSVEQAPPLGATFHVNIEGKPTGMLETLRRTIAQVDPAVPITRVRTLRRQADLGLTDERLATIIGVAAGGAAALLATVGLFAALSQAATRRRREMGIRIALGASPAIVGGLIMRQAFGVCALGSALGLGVGLALAKFVQARLYGVDSTDVMSFGAAAVLLCGTTMLAGWRPARRAAAVDPVTALKAD